MLSKPRAVCLAFALIVLVSVLFEGLRDSGYISLLAERIVAPVAGFAIGHICGRLTC